MAEAMDLITWQEKVTHIPLGPSGYIYGDNVFSQGASIFPHVLTRIARSHAGDGNTLTITTKRTPRRGSWKDVSQQELNVPKEWVLPIIDSDQMLAFTFMPGSLPKAIIPVNQQGRLLTHDEAILNEGWSRLNRIFAEINGQAHSTPPKLISRYRNMGALTRQLPLNVMDRNKPLVGVLYPKSGDIMRGCRYRPGNAIIVSGLYHRICDSSSEASYLVVLLNTPALKQAFKESQTSGRDFHLNPWKNIPIPKFDPENSLHIELAGLTTEAEDVASALLDQLVENLAEGQQLKNRIGYRKGLGKEYRKSV